jgi:hypothetical protein
MMRIDLEKLLGAAKGSPSVSTDLREARYLAIELLRRRGFEKLRGELGGDLTPVFLGQQVPPAPTKPAIDDLVKRLMKRRAKDDRFPPAWDEDVWFWSLERPPPLWVDSSHVHDEFRWTDGAYLITLRYGHEPSRVTWEFVSEDGEVSGELLIAVGELPLVVVTAMRAIRPRHGLGLELLGLVRKLAKGYGRDVLAVSVTGKPAGFLKEALAREILVKSDVLSRFARQAAAKSRRDIGTGEITVFRFVLIGSPLVTAKRTS